MSMLRLFDHPYGKEYFHRTFKSICKRGVRRIDKLRPLLAFSLSRGQTKHESQLPQRATEQCGNQHSLTVVVFVWFSSCHWKCSGAVVVLQKQVFTNNFKPLFSLVVRSRLSSRACYRSYLDSHPIFYSTSKNSHFEASYKLAVDSHNCRYSV